ncbi:MAG: ATPase, T2SS/T4P/T4SS family, partial [Patescibacteria group bacterium]
NIFFQKDLQSLSFNNIPLNAKNIADLKLPPVINDLGKLNSGLFIVAGPQLSGKTTTATAIIEEMNKNTNKRVITLEDPIEYLFVSKKSIVEQRQIGKDVNTILDGIDYCLKEDVDVVYIGEAKKDFDQVVPDILNLASGNAFVVFEVNADSSVRVLEKIINSLKSSMSLEAARYSLADILVGVIVQKLVPRVGGGMVLAREILLVNSAVKSLIREGRIYQVESILQTSRKEGMISMEKSLEELGRAGEIKESFRIQLT